MTRKSLALLSALAGLVIATIPAAHAGENIQRGSTR